MADAWPLKEVIMGDANLLDHQWGLNEGAAQPYSAKICWLDELLWICQLPGRWPPNSCFLVRDQATSSFPYQ